MRWFLPLLLLLAACDGSADGYRFEQEEWVHTRFQANVILAQDETELAKLFPGKQEGLMAFSRIDPVTGGCTIYVVDPRRRYEPEWLGHEVAHCVFGNWHPQQTEVRK